MTTPTASQTIRQTLGVLFQPGDVVELRVPEAGKFKTLSGYFDDMDKLAESAAKASGNFPGIYVTMNPCLPSLLARSANRAQAYAKATTSDNQILCRRWLLVDVDWQRPKGISTTDAEHEAAITKAYQIRDDLMLEGWPLPIVADSGNGAHLLYRTELQADDEGRTEATIKWMAERFNEGSLLVDTSVYNPSRIIKLYGTMVCKGDNLPDRPHRIAKIIDIPTAIQAVPSHLLILPEKPKQTNGKLTARNGFDGEKWMAEYASDATGPEPYNGGRLWKLPCPWRSDDGNTAFVIQFPNGAMSAGCQHDTCPGARSTGNHWDEFRKLREPKTTTRQQAYESTLPEVVVTARPLRDITSDAMNTLVGANDPAEIFVRAGMLVRVGADEHGEPVIEPLTESAVRGRLARCAEFIRVTQHGDTTPIAPPLDAVRDIMALGRWPFPPLLGITESPIVTPSGKTLTTTGYNEETRLFYAPGRLVMNNIPQTPTQNQVSEAIGLIEEVICDFPFENQASKANAISAMITPVVRPAIRGQIPLVLFDKPQAGTGASLLSEIVALIATGRDNAMMTAPKTDEEWNKAITATLKQGRTVVTIDNIEGLLFAAPLAAALTSTTWTSRLLGQSQMITLPQRATWIATGNNVRLGGDLPRRCYWVRLDAKTARPWQRNGFKHPRLIEWVQENRARILTAILTLARAWFVAEKPSPDGLPTMGGFEDWARTVGGILQLAGVTGFLGNIEQMYEQSDEETPQWEAFTQAWYDAFRAQPTTCNEVISEIDRLPALKDTIPDVAIDRNGGINARKLGKAMTRRNGMRFVNGLVIKKAGTSGRATRWVVTIENTKVTQPGLSAIKSEFAEFNEFGTYADQMNNETSYGLGSNYNAKTTQTHQTHEDDIDDMSNLDFDSLAEAPF